MSKFDSFGFPRGEERKKVVEKSQADIAEFQVSGKDKIKKEKHYEWLNSPVDGRDQGFGRPFYLSFRRILGEKGLRNYIEKILQKRRGKAIGIEFGGIGSAAFNGFSHRFFAKSIGVTLVDHRDSGERYGSSESEAKINHEVMIGDIFDPKTYQILNNKLNGEKVDFIVSRMAKGLEFVPLEPYTVSKILEVWYDLLREGGIMLVQTPVEFNNLLRVWVATIEKDFKNVLEMDFQTGTDDSSANCSAFRLRKLPGAPQKLPLLSPKAVGKIHKELWP